MASKKNISIVIPTLDRTDLLRNCLNSLEAQTVLPDEIIVVDNGSSGQTKRFLEQNFPNIKLISLTRNFGFARACNEGIKASRSELVAIVNNDVILDSNWIKEIINSAKRHPEGAAFVGKIKKAKKPKVIDSAGDQVTNQCEIKHRGEGELDNRQYDKEEYVFLVPATATVYKKVFFEKVGLFDEEFVSYFEDADIAFRGQLKGYKYLYVPTAKVSHIGKETSEKININRGYFELRNSLLVWIKNLPTKAFLSKGIWKKLITYYIKLGLKDMKPGKLALCVKVCLNLVTNLPKYLKKRKSIQSKVKVSEDYIIKSIIGVQR